jgi:hypothetical protein
MSRLNLAGENESCKSGSGFVLGCDDVDASQLDTLCADYILGYIVDLADTAPQDYNLQTIMLIEVYVQRRNCLEQMRMLQVYQPLRDHCGVVVIDQENRSDSPGLGIAQALAAQLLTNQVAERFGPALITLFGNELVKFRKQFLFQRYPYAFNLLHWFFSFK